MAPKEAINVDHVPADSVHLSPVVRQSTRTTRFGLDPGRGSEECDTGGRLAFQFNLTITG